ncbi:hypothetical protein [Agaribacterium haliotis]|uniref:hypothetical protein n=1 Tax=Agaribacterium haliotis TaxID=2013869 RepID=UPI000BB59EC8|nr:hypothetical protein [Agaribacterium haliotis]
MKQLSKQHRKQHRKQRHLGALFTFVALVPLVYFIPEFIQPLLPDNKLLQTTAAVAIIVPLIVYIIQPLGMPWLLKLGDKLSKNKQAER